MNKAKWLSLCVVFACILAAAAMWRLSPLSSPFRHETIFLAHVGEVGCLAFSPDGKYLVAGSCGIARNQRDDWLGALRVWHAPAWKEYNTIWLGQWVRSVSFSEDGSELAVICSTFQLAGNQNLPGFHKKDAEIIVFDFPSLKEKKTFTVAGFVAGGRFLPGRKIAVATGGQNPQTSGDVAIIDLETGVVEQLQLGLLTGS